MPLYSGSSRSPALNCRGPRRSCPWTTRCARRDAAVGALVPGLVPDPPRREGVGHARDRGGLAELRPRKPDFACWPHQAGQLPAGARHLGFYKLRSASPHDSRPGAHHGSCRLRAGGDARCYACDAQLNRACTTNCRTIRKWPAMAERTAAAEAEPSEWKSWAIASSGHHRRCPGSAGSGVRRRASRPRCPCAT